jgi:hypothetical protein
MKMMILLALMSVLCLVNGIVDVTCIVNCIFLIYHVKNIQGAYTSNLQDTK